MEKDLNNNLILEPHGKNDVGIENFNVVAFNKLVVRLAATPLQLKVLVNDNSSAG